MPLPLGELDHKGSSDFSSYHYRFAPQHLGGHNAAVRHSEECAIRARNLMDIDEPTIENVQVLLLLSNAFFQAGKGKKSYMLLSQYQDCR